MKLIKSDVPKAACKQTVQTKRRREMFAIITIKKPPLIPKTDLKPPNTRNYMINYCIRMSCLAYYSNHSLCTLLPQLLMLNLVMSYSAFSF